MKIIAGAENSEVIVELPNGTRIVPVITKSLTKTLGLKKGRGRPPHRPAQIHSPNLTARPDRGRMGEVR